VDFLAVLRLGFLALGFFFMPRILPGPGRAGQNQSEPIPRGPLWL